MVYRPREGEGGVGDCDAGGYECVDAGGDAALVFGEFSAGEEEGDWGGECGVSDCVCCFSSGFDLLGFEGFWRTDGGVCAGSV